MLTKTAFGIALVLATLTGSVAATKPHAVVMHMHQNIYNPYGAYIGTDPDPSIRFNLLRDASHGRY
jgi:hypothetical protein